ncbi:MAG: hypothetical protein EKK37_05310 [Sphingobacteriales bacterium]|nr:MAG: hypothetical protein EKK37_05310 [Sphingobacteriales bacterium]
MDHSAPRIDFALIGHQENWQKVEILVNTMRKMEGTEPLSLAAIKDIYPYIPPRKVFDITVNTLRGEPVQGIYVETFISPEHINIKHLQQNLSKVKAACICAASEGARIASLGGFTSIVLEAAGNPLQEVKNTFFTTGNTLTASFICKGIIKACEQKGKDIHQCKLLVVGSTGDIGSACVNYFAGVIHSLLLCARNNKQLQQQAASLQEKDINCQASVSLNALLPQADIIILVASSPVENWDTNLLKETVIICDAGYPKNIIRHLPVHLKQSIFCGGMGFISPGFYFTPKYMEDFYQYPCAGVSHGCLLESIVLSMEKKFEAFSTGRGNISKEKMEIILAMSKRNGIDVSPFFNTEEIWLSSPSPATTNYE